MSNAVNEVFDYARHPPSPEAARKATAEFRRLGRTCFSTLPEYQCFLYSPGALDDKIIATARDESTNTLLAFASTAILPGCTLPSGQDSGPIWNTGLTCISPDHQRSSLTNSLFSALYIYLLNERWPKGVWVTSIAAVPSSLVSISRTLTNVYPSPKVKRPSGDHIAIAKHCYKMYRKYKAIVLSEEATFDEDSFVIKDSCSVDSPFRKTSGYARYAHRDASANAFYLGLLGSDRDEVLQVGELKRERILEIATSESNHSAVISKL